MEEQDRVLRSVSHKHMDVRETEEKGRSGRGGEERGRKERAFRREVAHGGKGPDIGLNVGCGG